MKTYRTNAVIVGGLFTLAILTLFIGQALYNPFLSAPDYLEITYPNRTAVITGILVELLGVLGLALIPVLLFPVLKKHTEVLGLGYLCFRLLEVVLLTIAQINKLTLVNLSQDYLDIGRAEAANLQNLGSSIKASLYWNDSGGLIYLLVFVSGALILYSAFYKSRLIPRWLSIWGIIAMLAILAASVGATTGIFPETLAVILMLPVPLQELTMAAWLILKGFDPSAILSAPANK